MYFIVKKDLYWNGQHWTKNWRQATLYSNAPSAVKRLPEKTASYICPNSEQYHEIFSIFINWSANLTLEHSKP